MQRALLVSGIVRVAARRLGGGSESQAIYAPPRPHCRVRRCTSMLTPSHPPRQLPRTHARAHTHTQPTTKRLFLQRAIARDDDVRARAKDVHDGMFPVGAEALDRRLLKSMYMAAGGGGAFLLLLDGHVGGCAMEKKLTGAYRRNFSRAARGVWGKQLWV